eukprot:GHRR01000280.1.p1 GENE.GHRR01000280.1~~GHRR01000280.1.p1  ORF type:complete len:212 (+),score=84.79 GHRR01000280.1:82-717(+)
MAATFSAKRAFAAAQKPACSSRRETVAVRAQKGEANLGQAVAASFALAAILQATPALAGVILEKPQLKKVLQDDSPVVAAPKREIILPGQRSKAAPAAATAAAPNVKAPAAAETSGADLDPRAIALPASLVVIAGGAIALGKIDDGFGDFMRDASVKDSTDLGIGYETDLKGPGGAAALSNGKKAVKAGTKKVKAASKSAGSGIAAFFGKN